MWCQEKPSGVCKMQETTWAAGLRRLGDRGSAPDPTGRAYSAPPDPLADGEGAGFPLPKNLPPVNIWQSYKQERNCVVHFLRLLAVC